MKHYGKQNRGNTVRAMKATQHPLSLRMLQLPFAYLNVLLSLRILHHCDLNTTSIIRTTTTSMQPNPCWNKFMLVGRFGIGFRPIFRGSFIAPQNSTTPFDGDGAEENDGSTSPHHQVPYLAPRYGKVVVLPMNFWMYSRMRPTLL